MKKILLLFLFLFILTSCSQTKNISEENLKILERMAKGVELQEKREKCVKDELIKIGYTDGINCIIQPFKEICKDETRYNKEDAIYNECFKK